jgi:Tol biopolymer transport system component
VSGAQFGWVDPTGRLLQAVGESGAYGDLDVSPRNSELVAWTRLNEGAAAADVWVHNTATRAETPLTRDPADDINPVWSPDGERIAYTTYRKGNADIYMKNANGTGPETPILESASNESIEDWTGKYIAFKFGTDEFEDLYAQPVTPDGKPDGAAFPVVQGNFHKDEPQFSPDGRWLAYTSDEGGVFQVVVVSFPDLKLRAPVSTSGGGQPRWRADSKVLYYRGLAPGPLMAAEIKPGSTLEFTAPRLLFQSNFRASESYRPIRHVLEVSPGGDRFLLRVSPTEAARGRAGSGAAVLRGAPGNQGVNLRSGATDRLNARAAGTNSGLTVVLRWNASLGKTAP